MPGVEVVAVGPEDGAVLRRAPADPASARLRARRLRPPARPRAAATTSSTRRRSPTSRCSRRRPLRRLRPLPAGRRLDRGLDARVLARVPRRVGGRVGWWVQRAVRAHRRIAPSASRGCTRERLRELGLPRRGDGARRPVRGPAQPRTPRSRPEPVVVFAGRHIPEKRVTALVPAVARARERMPELRGEIYGDGPERDRVLRADRASTAWTDAVEAPGFVDGRAGRRRRCARALCLVLPSRREGYGLVVVEAAALGTPSVVVQEPDNAATELVEDGENGFVAPARARRSSPRRSCSVHEAGPALCGARRRHGSRGTRRRLSLESSLEIVLRAYAALAHARRAQPAAPRSRRDGRIRALRAPARPALLEARADAQLTVFASEAALRSLGESPGAQRGARRHCLRSAEPSAASARRADAAPAGSQACGVDLLHNLFTTAPAFPGVPQVTTILDVIYKRFPETHAGLLGARACRPHLDRPPAARSASSRSPRRRRPTSSVSSAFRRARRRHVPRARAPGDAARSPSDAPARPRSRRRRRSSSPSRRSGRTRTSSGCSKRSCRCVDERPVLVVPGYSTFHEDALRERATSSGDDRIRFTGWLDDDVLDGLFRAATCFVFPSLAEGFGLPVLDALVRGTPVACSNATSLPEVAGDAALYFDPTDTERSLQRSSGFSRIRRSESACARRDRSRPEVRLGATAAADTRRLRAGDRRPRSLVCRPDAHPRHRRSRD